MTAKLKDTLSVWAVPCSLAFLASFSVMAVEIVAGRMLARHVGASLYLWTSVIGVILGGMAVGNMLGGWIADRFDARNALAVVFLVSAVVLSALPYLNEALAIWSQWEADAAKVANSWPVSIATHAFLAFFLPAMSLGLISPIVTKDALEKGFATGRTVGNIYAWGALGSILGTLCTGFLLIKTLGTVAVVFSVAAMLGIAGVLVQPRRSVRLLLVSWPVVIGCIVGYTFYKHPSFRRQWGWAGGKQMAKEIPVLPLLYEKESEYSFIKVIEGVSRKRVVRFLWLDNLVNAICVPSNPTEMHYDYEKIPASLTVRFGQNKSRLRGLFIGGGGYVFPRFFQQRWPQGLAVVSEIDPAVTDANFQALELKPEQARIMESSSLDTQLDRAGKPGATNPIQIYHKDARIHIEDLLKQKRTAKVFEPFDFAYNDAFKGYQPAYQLCTKEFYEKVRELLVPETGMYCQNVFDIYDSGRFIGALYNTLREVFPKVYILCCNPDGPSTDPYQRDTFLVVGAFQDLDLRELGSRKGELAFAGSLLTQEHLKILEKRSRGVVLTDNFCPVENLLEEALKRREPAGYRR